jgi:hypothetical protein
VNKAAGVAKTELNAVVEQTATAELARNDRNPRQIQFKIYGINNTGRIFAPKGDSS